MKISRTGSASDHGTKHVDLTSPKFGWAKNAANLTIRHSRAKDFNTNSHHSYSIAIPSAEVSELLETLAKAALADPDAFEKELASSLKSLTQLQAVAAGLLSSKT